MSTDNDPKRAELQTAFSEWANVVRRCLSGVFVPRNTTGIPTDQVGSLGTSSFAWLSAFVQAVKLKANGHYITVQAPTLAANVTAKLMAALPSALANLHIDSSGQIAADLVNYALSSSCAVFSTANTSDTQVTNLSVSLACSGSAPVLLMLIPDGTTNPCEFTDAATTDGVHPFTTDTPAYYSFYKDGAPISIEKQCNLAPFLRFPSQLFMVDLPAAGTHTYDLRIRNAATTTDAHGINYCKLIAVEVFG